MVPIEQPIVYMKNSIDFNAATRKGSSLTDNILRRKLMI